MGFEKNFVFSHIWRRVDAFLIEMKFVGKKADKDTDRH